MSPVKTTRKKSSSQHSSSGHQLRIIGGQWRGRKLSIADVDGLRPTGDRIRETLFNWLMHDVRDSHCLDLFAGSGALGFECLSRGANQVHLFERHPRAVKQLQQHCEALNGMANNDNRGHIVEGDCVAWLKSTRNTLPASSIDIAFIDPPFEHDLWEGVIAELDASKVLKLGAMIYIESPRDKQINTPDSWQLRKEKSTGQVCYRLFEYVLLGGQDG